MAHHLLIFIFGILGNIISFMVYLAPVPTFWRIYKKKSTEGFHSVPYVCAILSSMLWIYYALLKTNSLLITINGSGCIIETLYLVVFLTYAPKKAKMATVKLVVLLNLLGFSSIIFVCTYLAKASIRVQVLGWFCVAVSVVVFAAPLSIIRSVIQTKSVEFMPFPLSFSLTISAVLWFMYGLLQKDLYIVLPNVIGFLFGVAQMVLYGIYRNSGKVEEELEMRLPETMAGCSPVKVNDTSISAEVHPIRSLSVIDTTKKELAIDMTKEEAKDEDSRNNNNKVYPHSPSSCGNDEIKIVVPASSPATTIIQVVNCTA